jgi:tetratricopeptide (TPR) repeat protein
LARNPDDPTVVSLIGRCYEQVDNLESAYRNFARATEIQRFDRHWLDLARICMKLGDLERFEQVANYMRSLDPQDGGVAMLRGKVAQKDGRYAEALTEFDTARTTDPVWQTVPALTESAVTYVALGDTDAASKAFSDALKVDPDYVPALEGFADWAIESNDWKLATGPLQRLCDRHPHEVRFFNKLAQCLKQSDQDDDAVFVLTSYTLNNPQDPAGFGNLGIVLFQIGRMEEAVYNYYKALELDPNYIFARYNLANTLEYQEDVDGALSEYRQVLERNPAFHDVLIRVLKIHANRQDYDAALAELEAVAKRTSVNWTAIETEPELHLLVQDDRYRALREERAGRSSASQ